MHLLQTTAPAPDLDPDDIANEYAGRGYRALSDDHLFDVAARLVAMPKRDPASSFSLHAPLELLARRSLLAYVEPAHREPIRERLLWVAAKYHREAEAAERGTGPGVRVGRGRSRCAAGCTGGWRPDRGRRGRRVVDRPCVARGDHGVRAGADRQPRGGRSCEHLLLPADAPRAPSRSALALFRPLVHEVARLAALRVEWTRTGVEAHAERDGADLARAMAATPRLGLPGSDFIFPIVHQVDNGGLARDVIGSTLPDDIDTASRAILRVAAQSMLQDDPASTPYGWTHCLTLPQAVLANAARLDDPRVGIAIAATYVIGFRAAEGRHYIEADHVPEPVTVDVFDALAAEPNTWAAAVYHAVRRRSGRHRAGARRVRRRTRRRARGEIHARVLRRRRSRPGGHPAVPRRGRVPAVVVAQSADAGVNAGTPVLRLQGTEIRGEQLGAA